MKTIKYIIIFLAGCIVAYLFLSSGADISVNLTKKEIDIKLSTYLSFLSVMLTATTVVLAALAIGIGVVAFYTIREIKDEAQKIAAEKADKVAKESLSEAKLKNLITNVIGKNGAPFGDTENWDDNSEE